MIILAELISFYQHFFHFASLITYLNITFVNENCYFKPKVNGNN